MRSSTMALLSLFLVFDVAAQEVTKNNWLLVTTPDLREAFEPLVNFRREDGYRVLVFDDWQSDDAGEDDSIERILTQIERVRDTAAQTFVLIGGSCNASKEAAFVPPSVGRHGRMRGQTTDYYFSLPDAKGEPTVAVGRLPARSSAEASAMVRKVIRCSTEPIGTTAPHLGIIVAHPGGETQLERQFGEAFLQSTISDRLKEFDSEMRVKVIADIESSQFAKPNQNFGKLATELLSAGNLFTVYSGHSSASGLWSNSGCVVSRDEFAKINTKGNPGVFLSCGCFTCQTDTKPGSQQHIKRSNGKNESVPMATHGFGIAAICNPNGPAAVVGPYGESYAIFGKLAFDALQNQLKMHKPTSRIGSYWTAVQRKLLNGKVDALTFFMFDQADGSRGKTTLAKQRHEHVEMWTLLGDPAMLLPPIPARGAKVNSSVLDAKRSP